METELTILSDILLDNEIMAECIGVLKDTDFQSKTNGIVYRAMFEMYKSRIPIDPVTLANSLGDKVYAAIGGMKYMLKMQCASPGKYGYKQHIALVKTESDRLKLIKACQEAIEQAEECKNTQEIISELESKFIKTNDQHNVLDLDGLFGLTLQIIEDGFNNGGQINGVSTGYKALDNATGGFNKGDLMVIAARPSMGKTALILNMMSNIPKGDNAMLFELEMSEGKLGARLMSSRVGINPKLLSRGAIGERDFEPIIKVTGLASAKNNLFFDCRAGLNVSQIRSEANKIKIKHGLSVIFVDHIGIMRPDNPKSSRNDQIGTISRELKAIAKDLDVCVVCLSQLNRSVEGRADKQPGLSDLRDSGNIEQDSDQVLLLYREDYYKDENDIVSNFEIIIAKNRDGECGKILLQYDTNTQLIYE